MKKEYTLRRILWQTNDEGTEMITLVATHLSADCLLQSIARVDFRQAAVLSQTVDWLQRKASRFSFLTGNNMPLSTTLSKALLLFIQDEDTLGGRILTEKEVINKFLSYLHIVYTGKADFQSNAEWTNLATCIIEENKSKNTVNMKNEELNIPDEANNLPVSEQSKYAKSFSLVMQVFACCLPGFPVCSICLVIWMRTEEILKIWHRESAPCSCCNTSFLRKKRNIGK